MFPQGSIIGALGSLPFGGPGESGNHWPSAGHAANCCACSVARVDAGLLLP